MIVLPQNWTEIYSKLTGRGIFATCLYSGRTIIYYFPWWFPWPFRGWVRRHERAHAWGIRDCLSKRKTCLMYEDDDTWRGKIKLLPFWLAGMGRFCDKCKTFLTDAIK